MEWTIRGAALALDLDGTLLDGAGRLREGTAALLRRAVRAGLPVVLASGRMFPAVLPIHRALGLDTPVVSYNGARILRPGEAPIRDAALPPGLARRGLAFARARGWHVNVYAGDRLWAVEENATLRAYAEHFRVPYALLPDLDHPALDRPTKLLVIVEEEDLAATHAAVRDAFPGEADTTTSSARFVEVLPPETDKGRALALLADRLACPLARWVAVGDGRNDLEMIRAAGIGVAVATAPEEVREAADRVVPPLWEGGLEEVLREGFGWTGRLAGETECHAIESKS